MDELATATRSGGELRALVLVGFFFYGGVDSATPRDFMISHRLELLIAAAE